LILYLLPALFGWRVLADVFAPDYAEQLGAARRRLAPEE
jgi:hypothetical protein